MKGSKLFYLVIFVLSLVLAVGCRADREHAEKDRSSSSIGVGVVAMEKSDACWDRIGPVAKVLGRSLLPVVFFFEDRFSLSPKSAHFNMPQSIVESVSEKLSRKIDAQFNSYIQSWLDENIVMLVRRNIDFKSPVWYFEQV